jgi:hypothetical protein
MAPLQLSWCLDPRANAFAGDAVANSNAGTGVRDRFRVLARLISSLFEADFRFLTAFSVPPSTKAT